MRLSVRLGLSSFGTCARHSSLSHLPRFRTVVQRFALLLILFFVCCCCSCNVGFTGSIAAGIVSAKSRISVRAVATSLVVVGAGQVSRRLGNVLRIRILAYIVVVVLH